MCDSWVYFWTLNIAEFRTLNLDDILFQISPTVVLSVYCLLHKCWSHFTITNQPTKQLTSDYINNKHMPTSFYFHLNANFDISLNIFRKWPEWCLCGFEIAKKNSMKMSATAFDRIHLEWLTSLKIIGKRCDFHLHLFRLKLEFIYSSAVMRPFHRVWVAMNKHTVPHRNR